MTERDHREPPTAPAQSRHAELRYAGVGFVVFFLLSAGVVALTGGSGSVRQPIEFNHRLHAEDAGLDCLDCHEYYEKETFSGLPDAETCAFCHEVAQGESAEEQKLVELLEAGAPLEWRPLFRQPPHVFYSHRRHVVVAGIECESCHGSIAQSEVPPTRAELLTMDDCLECHRREGAAEDCTACHR